MKHFFIDLEAGDLHVWDDEKHLLHTIRRVATRAGEPNGATTAGHALTFDQAEKLAEPTQRPETGKKVRRCKACGKAGHRKDHCPGMEGARTDKKETTSTEIFSQGRTFEECDRIADETDGMKGENLQAFLRENKLTVHQLYQIRYKVKQRWQADQDARYKGTPATSREGQADEPTE